MKIYEETTTINLFDNKRAALCDGEACCCKEYQEEEKGGLDETLEVIISDMVYNTKETLFNVIWERIGKEAKDIQKRTKSDDRKFLELISKLNLLKEEMRDELLGDDEE